MPDLGLPAIKAKVDTGAKTSALHAFKVEESCVNGSQYVNFHIHPKQKNTDIVIICEAKVFDKRNVRDSGGHEEERYVIKTTLEIGNMKWPIELTLTSRDDMMFRMLLGRNALIDGGFSVDPASSYLASKRPVNQASLYSGDTK